MQSLNGNSLTNKLTGEFDDLCEKIYIWNSKQKNGVKIKVESCIYNLFCYSISIICCKNNIIFDYLIYDKNDNNKMFAPIFYSNGDYVYIDAKTLQHIRVINDVSTTGMLNKSIFFPDGKYCKEFKSNEIDYKKLINKLVDYIESSNSVYDLDYFDLGINILFFTNFFKYMIKEDLDYDVILINTILYLFIYYSDINLFNILKGTKVFSKGKDSKSYFESVIKDILCNLDIVSNLLKQNESFDFVFSEFNVTSKSKESKNFLDVFRYSIGECYKNASNNSLDLVHKFIETARKSKTTI